MQATADGVSVRWAAKSDHAMGPPSGALMERRLADQLERSNIGKSNDGVKKHNTRRLAWMDGDPLAGFDTRTPVICR